MYDAFSDIIEASDPNGNHVANEHDALSRRVRRELVTWSGVDVHVPDETFAYDGLSRLIEHGRADGSGRHVTLTHDSRGNVLTETAVEAGIGAFTLRHVYDVAGVQTFACLCCGLLVLTPGALGSRFAADAGTSVLRENAACVA